MIMTLNNNNKISNKVVKTKQKINKELKGYAKNKNYKLILVNK